jgi:hypothetical protein
MNFKTHIYAIIASIIIFLVPNLFGLTETTFWGVVQLLGLLLIPGLSFSLFLRKWNKAISDDIAFAVTILVSILWVSFLVSWYSIQGAPFDSESIFFSMLGATVIFTALGALPNGRDLTSSEPVKYKYPMAIATVLVFIFGILGYSLADKDNLFLSGEEATTNVVSLVGQTDNSVTFRVYSPSKDLVRTTLFFEDVATGLSTEIFTDILKNGDNYLTLKLPATGESECRKFKLIYSNSSESDFYYDDIYINSYGCSSSAESSLREALPTNREELLDFIYEKGQLGE